MSNYNIRSHIRRIGNNNKNNNIQKRYYFYCLLYVIVHNFFYCCPWFGCTCCRGEACEKIKKIIIICPPSEGSSMSLLNTFSYNVQFLFVVCVSTKSFMWGGNSVGSHVHVVFPFSVFFIIIKVQQIIVHFINIKKTLLVVCYPLYLIIFNKSVRL